MSTQCSHVSICFHLSCFAHLAKTKPNFLCVFVPFPRPSIFFNFPSCIMVLLSRSALIQSPSSHRIKIIQSYFQCHFIKNTKRPFKMTVITIKWGREKKSFDFPERALADVRLGELRKGCHDWSRVPLGGLTLIYGGATMKDDNAPLSCFGIKPNAQIVMMGTRPSVSS